MGGGAQGYKQAVCVQYGTSVRKSPSVSEYRGRLVLTKGEVADDNGPDGELEIEWLATFIFFLTSCLVSTVDASFPRAVIDPLLNRLN